MSIPVTGDYAASKIQQNIPNSVVSSDDTNVWIKAENLVDVFSYLKDDAELDMQFLNSISAVDYIEYFELVYHLRSLRNNTTLIIKTKCFGREEITVPSITSVWRGAELQEREIWDLMGINFSDHPNMKRILLWEGFPGHPLRKDFIR
ncbi:MAG: NADH-quinone oxidoreductase subunit C [Dehalococcoidia bacterium]|nr:NADH-quinone oxidoreductase subunit C [Chloroflexota bacterium]|tara:strand:+ start:613 stop:1056 length:444 start_codon:yes stop_codon:yes gene_type:complete